jgi:CheY-like chemotaxis protein
MNPSYKVIYVDEEQEWRDIFTRYARYKAFIVEAIPPPESIDELIDYIYRSSADAAVLDHRLSENMPNINYDGVDVVEKIRERNPRFPLFVLTSHDLEAIRTADDVNYVYPKSVISIKNQQGERPAAFNERIEIQIQHYKTAMANAEKECDGLLAKADNQPLDSDEEDRLITLDTLLSQQIGRDLDIPPHLKETSNAKLTQELIDVTEALLDKIADKQAGKDA